jgi:hypothetical protein
MAYIDLKHDLYALATVSAGLFGLTVCRIHERNSERRDDLFIGTEHVGESSGIVTWSPRITAKEIRSIIRSIDEKMYTQGFVVKKTLERIPITAPSIKGKLVVDDIFIWPERKMWLPQGSAPYRELLNRFDRPSEVVHVFVGDASYICRQRDVKRIAMRLKLKRRALEAVLTRNKLTYTAYLELSPSKTLKIERELAKELDQIFATTKIGSDPSE